MNTYNTKYILTYCNPNKDKLSIEIQKKDYIGEAFVLVNDDVYLTDDNGEYVVMNIDGQYSPLRDINAVEGGRNPFTLEYRNDESSKGGTIRATSATMQFYESLVFNIEDLATSDETELRCVFYFNDAVEWIGFVTPDFFNVEITENPIIDLTASDRLGILKDIPFNLGVSDENNLASYLSVITDVLKQTGLQLRINTVCDFECEEWNETDFKSVFSSTYINKERFVKDDESILSCYDVLKALCDQFNCLVTQYRGEWWIMNKDQLEGQMGNVNTFDYNGVFIESKSFVNKEINFNLINTGGEKTIIPAHGVSTLKLAYGKPQKYPFNGDFQKASSGSFSRWIDAGFQDGPILERGVFPTFEKPLIYDVNGSVLAFTVVPKQGLFVNWRPNPHFNGNPDMYLSSNNPKSIITQPIEIPDLDSQQIEMTLSIDCTSKADSIHIFLVYFETIDTVNSKRIYNLLKRDSYGKDNIETLFVRTENNLLAPGENHYKGAVLVRMPKQTASVNYSVSVIDTLSIQLPQEVIDNRENTRMYIQYFGCFQQITTVNAVLWDVDVKFKSTLEEPKGTTYKTEVEGNYTKSYQLNNVLFSDYETAGKNGFFYRYRKDSLSNQFNSLGLLTKNWSFINDPNIDSQLLHTIRQLAKRNGKAYQELRIGFDLNRINPFSWYSIKGKETRFIQVGDKYLINANGTYITVDIGKYLNNKKFIMVDGSMDYLRSEFTGVLAEVVNKDVQSKEYLYSEF